MKETWKIKNISDQRIKLTVAVSNTAAPGLFLEPNQFCLSMRQMTAPLDKQATTGFLSIDEEYENVQNLELAKAYNATILDSTNETTAEYIK